MKEQEDKLAATVTVGSKGQIVIPKELRQLFSIEPGDTLLILGDRERGIAIPPKGQFQQLFAQIFGEAQS